MIAGLRCVAMSTEAGKFVNDEICQANNNVRPNLKCYLAIHPRLRA